MHFILSSLPFRERLRRFFDEIELVRVTQTFALPVFGGRGVGRWPAQVVMRRAAG
jgi:hypothetical protein